MKHAGTSSRSSVYQRLLAKLCYRPAFPKGTGKTTMGRNIQNTTAKKGEDNLSGQPALKAAQPSIGVPVTADKVECINTPANDREGEELIIGEPAEDILVTHAPTEAPLNDIGLNVANEVECNGIPADEREGMELVADKPAEDIMVTPAPIEAPQNETGPDIANEVKCTKPPVDEREGKELAADKPAEVIPVAEAPIERPPSETGVPSSGDKAESAAADTLSADQSPQQEEQT